MRAVDAVAGWFELASVRRHFRGSAAPPMP
jgi:hypothetical protein